MTCARCNGRGYFTPPLIGPFDGVAICPCPAGRRLVIKLLAEPAENTRNNPEKSLLEVADMAEGEG